MNIVVLKSEEDELLADCDNSCINEDKCVCKRMLGMQNSGQGMYHYGINRCVLCCRSDATHSIYPYRVVVDGYPNEWVVGGVFIRFNIDDYETDGKRVIKQVFKVDETKFRPKTWVSKLYDTAVIKISKTSTRWFLTICDNDECKSRIHSYIDEHRSIGINNSYMDLTVNKVVCIDCGHELKFIHDSDGLVMYKGINYSRCRFCSTIVHYKSANAIQICTTCLDEQHNELKILERVCFYCNNNVPINKRGGSQKLRIKYKDGTVKDSLLCRHHKIKNLDQKKVFEYEYILSHLFSNTFRTSKHL